MHAKINNAQFGIGFTLKRSDLIKPQPPDNKRAVCIIPQMLPLPSWGNWFHGCSPRMLLNIWHLGIWKHIDVLLHVHRSLIETVKLFTVRRSHLFGGNHIFCQPAAVLINAGFLWPLLQTSQTSPFQKYVLKINIALNISHFEHYNFTYSSRQVASKHRAKILFSHISLFVSKFSLEEADNRASWQHSDVQMQNVFESSTSTAHLSHLSLFYSPLLCGFLMFEVPLSQSALQRRYIGGIIFAKGEGHLYAKGRISSRHKLFQLFNIFSRYS